MTVRAVPDGDERDKDVANAIRYAVDNGAQIINMSFGKEFSPQRAAVEAGLSSTPPARTCCWCTPPATRTTTST
ncbi:MAG: S8 family serine peptidase [Hymenobacter sp.]